MQKGSTCHVQSWLKVCVERPANKGISWRNFLGALAPCRLATLHNIHNRSLRSIYLRTFGIFFMFNFVVRRSQQDGLKGSRQTAKQLLRHGQYTMVGFCTLFFLSAFDLDRYGFSGSNLNGAAERI